MVETALFFLLRDYLPAGRLAFSNDKGWSLCQAAVLRFF